MLFHQAGPDGSGFLSIAGTSLVCYKTETVVFALDAGKYPSNDKGRRVREQITDQTGGRVFDGLSQKDLAQAFAEIKAEIENMYGVNFSPTEPVKSGEFRSIVLKTIKDGKLKIRAPKGYYVNSPRP